MISEKIGNGLLDAILKRKPQEMDKLFTEDCKVFIPFPKEKKICGIKNTLTYIQQNHRSPKKEF